MDNLRIVLIVIASLVIIALLIHGFWINKKERSSLFDADKNRSAKNKQQREHALNWQEDESESEFTDGVGKVRVISNREPETIVIAETPTFADTVHNDIPVQRDFFSDNTLEEEEVKNEIENTELPQSASLDEAKAQSYAKEMTTAEQSIHLNQDANKETTEKKTSTKTDVLVFHITGLNNSQLRGDLLLSSIIQSGFRFGEMQIFHRHLDPAGNGPVLFSLANMMKPGTLDPETMHEFTSPGVSIFMMIPSYGNTQQNFKLMLQTAQRIADDVNGVVLDDEHHMLTPQKIDSYKERVKAVMQEQ